MINEINEIEVEYEIVKPTKTYNSK